MRLKSTKKLLCEKKMDFVNVYSSAFSNAAYSSSHHIQYDFVRDNVVKLKLENNKIIDIGSGRGQVIRILDNSKEYLRNYSITSVDLKKFHSENVNEFIECNLSKSDDREKLMGGKFDILVCTDVFEHLDKSFIEDVIKMCSQLARHCILTIANHSDIINGIELHTIQEPDSWWESILDKYFVIKIKETHYKGQLYNYYVESKYI